MTVLIFPTQNRLDVSCGLKVHYHHTFCRNPDFFSERIGTPLDILNKGCSIYILFAYKNEFPPLFFLNITRCTRRYIYYLKLVMFLQFHELFIIQIWCKKINFAKSSLDRLNPKLRTQQLTQYVMKIWNTFHRTCVSGLKVRLFNFLVFGTNIYELWYYEPFLCACNFSILTSLILYHVYV